MSSRFLVLLSIYMLKLPIMAAHHPSGYGGSGIGKKTAEASSLKRRGCIGFNAVYMSLHASNCW